MECRTEHVCKATMPAIATTVMCVKLGFRTVRARVCVCIMERYLGETAEKEDSYGGGESGVRKRNWSHHCAGLIDCHALR